MTTSLELRDLIESAISGAGYTVYANRAPEDAVYPYAVFRVRTLTPPDEEVRVGYLEVNAWDLYDTFSRVDNMLDEIESKLKNKLFKNNGASFRAFVGERQIVDDENKSIKRAQEKFNLRYTEREETQ